MSADVDIVVSFSLRLSGGQLSIDRLRSTMAATPELQVSKELEVSVDFGPTRDWRSVSKLMVKAVQTLVHGKEEIGFGDIEASFFMASPHETTWIFPSEVIEVLAQAGAPVFVRILDTSKQPNQRPQTNRTFGPRG